MATQQNPNNVHDMTSLGGPTATAERGPLSTATGASHMPPADIAAQNMAGMRHSSESVGNERAATPVRGGTGQV